MLKLKWYKIKIDYQVYYIIGLVLKLKRYKIRIDYQVYYIISGYCKFHAMLRFYKKMIKIYKN